MSHTPMALLLDVPNNRDEADGARPDPTPTVLESTMTTVRRLQHPCEVVIRTLAPS